MGSQLFGSHAAWLLLGFLVSQTHTYYRNPSKDHPIFKILVYALVLSTVAQSATEGFFENSFLVFEWGNPGPLFVNQSSATTTLVDLHPLFDAVPALFVQFYFTWRIWTFCTAVYGRRVKLLAVAFCLFIILASTCAFLAVVTLTALLLTPTPEPVSIVAPFFLVWTVTTVVADAAITACMMTMLYNARANFYFGEMRDRTTRLIRLTIQTGLLTSILALPIGPLYFRDQPGGEYGLTIFLLNKSYLISLLANLNFRWYRPIQHFPEESNVVISAPHTSTRTFDSRGNHPVGGNWNGDLSGSSSDNPSRAGQGPST